MGDRRRRWEEKMEGRVVEDEIGGGGGEKIGRGEYEEGMGDKRRRWVVEEEIGGDGGEKIGGFVCLI